MSTLFGMAGLAEAGEAYALTVCWGGLLLVAVFAAPSFILRSPTAAAFAIILVLVLGMLSAPWSAFLPVTSDDPDVRHWASAWRVFNGAWALGVVAVIAAAFRAYGRGRQAPAREVAPCPESGMTSGQAGG